MCLCSWIDERLETTQDKPAIVFDGQAYSYSELAEGVASLATVMQAVFGVKQGDRVAYLGSNSPRMIEALFACAKTAAILVPLNWRLAVPELVQILVDAGVTLLITGDDKLDAAVTISKQLENCRVVHAYQNPLADAVSSSWPALQALQLKAGAAETGVAERPGNPVLILYTSGTTGKPKGVVLTQDMLVWSARNSVAMHEMNASDQILMVLPMFHAGGFNIQTLPALSVGATVILHEGFEPGSVLTEINSGGITLAGLVPAQINAMLAHPDWDNTDMSRLRCITTGSTVVPDSCIQAWQDRGVPALQVYGATETCAVAIHQRVDNAVSTRGSVGLAAEHCRVRVVNDDGLDLPPGEHGELLIKGPNVFKTYWCNPEATAEALSDGWFHSCDIGFQRPDGSFVISDRKADLIISGGENIYPAELEAILNVHPQIIDAAVIGRFDERWGEVAVAFVVTATGSDLTEDEILSMFENRLARFKHPREVKLVAQLPRNAMGKIEKFELRKMIAGQFARQTES